MLASRQKVDTFFVTASIELGAVCTVLNHVIWLNYFFDNHLQDVAKWILVFYDEKHR